MDDRVGRWVRGRRATDQIGQTKKRKNMINYFTIEVLCIFEVTCHLLQAMDVFDIPVNTPVRRWI